MEFESGFIFSELKSDNYYYYTLLIFCGLFTRFYAFKNERVTNSTLANKENKYKVGFSQKKTKKT